MSDPFDWLKSVTETGEDLWAEGRRDYPAFLVNRGLSMHLDCLIPAAIMNMMPDLPKELQYKYLLNTIQKRRRYSGKWPKALEDELVDDIQLVLGYNRTLAMQTVPLLTDGDKVAIRDHAKTIRLRIQSRSNKHLEIVPDHHGDADEDRDTSEE